MVSILKARIQITRRYSIWLRILILLLESGADCCRTSKAWQMIITTVVIFWESWAVFWDRLIWLLFEGWRQQGATKNIAIILPLNWTAVLREHIGYLRLLRLLYSGHGIVIISPVWSLFKLRVILLKILHFWSPIWILLCFICSEKVTFEEAAEYRPHQRWLLFHRCA